jgi:hypothetical protein
MPAVAHVQKTVHFKRAKQVLRRAVALVHGEGLTGVRQHHFEIKALQPFKSSVGIKNWSDLLNSVVDDCHGGNGGGEARAS